MSASNIKVGNIIIAGPPAAGKGTQCELLLERYGLVHISTGDLLRARSKHMPELAAYMDNGKLVPDEIICKIVQERLNQKDCENGVLLDGFPRTLSQAEMLKSLGVHIDKFLLLDVPDEVVIERVEGRRVDPVSGKIYHIKHKPPPTKEIAARLKQRTDDTREKITSRLTSYHSNTQSILEFYKEILIAIKFRAPTGHSGFLQKFESLPLTSTPEIVFDRVRMMLEGDQYWGSWIQTKLSIKSYECGTHTASLVSIAR